MPTTDGVAGRWLWPCTIALLAVMGTVQVTSALKENNTWDEAIDLAAGYRHLKAGDFRMTPEHGALGKLLTALPLLWFDPVLPAKPRSGTCGRRSAMAASSCTPTVFPPTPC